MSGNSTLGPGGGGGIASFGTVTLTESTISNNNAAMSGGGLLISSGGSLTLDASTVRDNTAGYLGGGIVSFDGETMDVTKSTIRGNPAPSVALASARLYASSEGKRRDATRRRVARSRL